MSDRRATTLGALCAEGGGGIQTGPFGSQLHASDYVAHGVPSVMPQNIGDNVIREEGIARIREADAQRLAKYRMRNGDIVYSRRGDVEKRALVRDANEGWLCGTGCLRVRLGDGSEHDPKFVSYLLGTEESRAWIVRHAVGATMPNLNTSILSAVPLEVPVPSEQQAIAQVLGALDDKIAANTKIAATAEALGEAYFRYLMQGAAVVATLGEILTLEYGKSLPATLRNSGSVHVYGSGGIAGSHDEALCNEPGVVVGRKGTAGAVHWAPRPFYPIDTTFYVVTQNPDVSQIFAYFLLMTLGLDEMNNDSAVPGLNRNEAHASRIRVPEASALRNFTEAATKLFTTTAQLELESRSLAATRDALLPQLMSGKLRVKDAETVLEEAGV